MAARRAAPPQAQAPVSIWGDRLASMQAGAKQAMTNYDPDAWVQVPPAQYIAREACELGLTGAGEQKVTRKFIILEGEHTNFTVYENVKIENNDTGLHIIRRWVEMHIDPNTQQPYVWPEDNLPELEYMLADINAVSAPVQIRVKYTPAPDGGFYTNVNVNKILSEEDIGGISQDPAGQDYAATQEAAAQDQGVGQEIPQDDDTSVEPYDQNQSVDDQAFDPNSAGAQDEEQERQDLLVLAASHGIDNVNDSMGRDEIVAGLGQWKYEDNELTPDENALLENVGLAVNINRHPSPPKPRSASPAPRQAPAPRQKPKAAAPAPRQQPRAAAPRQAPQPAARPTARPATRQAAARPIQRGPQARVGVGKK
jgi:hypothetical protein